MQRRDLQRSKAARSDPQVTQKSPKSAPKTDAQIRCTFGTTLGGLVVPYGPKLAQKASTGRPIAHKWRPMAPDIWKILFLTFPPSNALDSQPFKIIQNVGDFALVLVSGSFANTGLTVSDGFKSFADLNLEIHWTNIILVHILSQRETKRKLNPLDRAVMSVKNLAGEYLVPEIFNPVQGFNKHSESFTKGSLDSRQLGNSS